VEEAVDILGLGYAELLEKAKARMSSGSGAAGKIYARAFSTGRLDPSGLGLSRRSEEAWLKAFSLRLLKPLRVLSEGLGPEVADSPDRITAKAALGLEDGSEIECVRIPMLGGEGTKSTLCVSSQVGCRMGCAFCETGRSGLRRNLRASEIVAQVLTAKIALGWDCGNIVFMGMGECLDNLAEVATALRVLADQRGLGYAQERMTLCTSGPAGGVEELRKLGLKRLGLSISLNAATDEKRERLMPVNRGNGLEALASSLAAYPLRRNFALGVNWCLMPGINDSREDASQAAAFCAKVGRSVVNLIPYNPGSSPLTRAPTEEEVESFASWLAEEGCLVKRRSTKGSRIMAGCGQLGGKGDSSV
jgi:23S rRNA (adenine2503-C2)-methyltransferase